MPLIVNKLTSKFKERNEWNNVTQISEQLGNISQYLKLVISRYIATDNNRDIKPTIKDIALILHKWYRK